jgi:uncharacterized membrane protein YhhN
VDALPVALSIFLCAVAAALAGVELRRPLLFGFAKPAATLALLLFFPPRGSAGTLVAAGIVLSAAGDVALLFDRDRAAFVAGVVLFLLAQLAYATAFLTGGAIGESWTVFVGVAIFGTASAWLVRKLLAGASAGLRGPLVTYAAAITVMVSAAFASLGGPWPEPAANAAAMGAVLFYVSDVTLAWRLAGGAFPHAQTVTLALYWSGQLGIALAARWAG